MPYSYRSAMFCGCFMTLVLFKHPRVLELPDWSRPVVTKLCVPSNSQDLLLFQQLGFFSLLSSRLHVPFKIYVINTHDGFKYYCYLYKCPFCFWVLSLSDIVWQQIIPQKMQLKWVIFPFTGFEFVSLNCHLFGWGFLYYRPRKAIFPCLCSLTLLLFI